MNSRPLRKLRAKRTPPNKSIAARRVAPQLTLGVRPQVAHGARIAAP